MKSGRNIIVFMYSISVIAFMTSILLAPALVPISEFIGGDLAIVKSQFLAVIPSASALIVSLVWTKVRIAHHYWGKLLFLVSLILYGLTGVMCYWEQEFSSMIITRLVLGVAMGFISMLLVQRGHLYLSEKKERLFVRTQGLVVGIALMFIVLLSGLLGSYSWNTPFLIYLLAFYPILYGLWMYVQGIGLHARRVERPSNYFESKKFWMIIVGAFLFVLYMSFYFLQLPFLVNRLPFTEPMHVSGLLGLLIIIFILGSTFYAPLFHYFRREIIYYVTLIMIGVGTYLLSVSFDINRVFLSLLIIGSGSGLLFMTAYNSIRYHIPKNVYGLWKYKLLSSVFLAQILAPTIIYALRGDHFIRLFFMAMSLVVLLLFIIILSIRLFMRNLDQRKAA